jgi:EmrB/QacA subfamily drug resistance transporter
VNREADRSPSPWIAFSAISVGVFMSTLDGSIVNVALPSIRHDLRATIAGASLVVSAYLLTVTATLLAVGRLGDLLGLRRVFVAGMLVFTVGSCFCGVARALAVLVAARVLQALGAAAMMAISPAAVTAAFPREKRGRALGGISSVVAAGLTAGPPIGGAIVSTFSWPGIFFVNLPVGIAGAIWAWRALPADTARTGARFDVPGALWLAVALAAFIGAIDLAPTQAAFAGGLAAVSGAAWLLLWRRERRAPSPLIDAALFRDRAFSLAIVAALLSYAALFSQTLLTPFYLAQVKRLGPGALGAMLTCVPLALSVTAPIAGALADRFGARGPCIAGALVLGAGLFSLSVAGIDSSLPSIAARLAVEGVGLGLFQAPNNTAIMSALPRERLGSGGGMLAMARTLGMVIGVALSGALFAIGSGRSVGPGTVTGAAAARFLAGWRLALSVGAALAVTSGVLSIARPRRRPGAQP